MIRSMWSLLAGAGGRSLPARTASDIDWYELASGNRLAKDLRDALQAQAKLPNFITQQLPALTGQLGRMSWQTLEIEKVLAYAYFYSGADERGYQHVIQHRLAEQDYTVFMTACAYCYLADRFAEGAALLDMFDPHQDLCTNWCEYLAFAGYIHVAAGRPMAQALNFFDQALDQGCFSPLLAINAYPIYFEAGRIEQCRNLKALIQRNCQDDPEVQFAMACVELARGYYGEGFRLMEKRYHMPEVARSMNATLLQKPRWDGKNLSGKHLLVHGEQGLGDMIMMSRYLPALREQGAELLVDCRAETLSLLSHNFPFCRFIACDLKSPILEPFDLWTGVMSLPYHFNTTALEVPATDGYLTVPDEQKMYWRERIAEMAVSARLRVGLTWSGNPGHRADKRRSLGFESVLLLALKHSDVRFFSLQTHVPQNHPSNLIDVADELVTLADTAAVIAEMDLVISVDTLAIHLAGALGCPAWLLMPHRYEWRWGLEGETNAWYGSVKVWRQPQPGAWSAVLEQVGFALHGHTATGVN